MTRQAELQTQRDELEGIISSKDFLTDFQKTNYNLLITNYHEPADNSARDYDTYKAHYDKLAEGDPKKAQYKAKVDKAESELKPNKEALDNLKNEILTMETIINKIDAINTKIDGISKQPAQPAQTITQTTPCPCDIKGMSEQIKDLKELVKNKQKSILNSIINGDFPKDKDKITTDPNQFFNWVKTEPSKNHALFKQDPITKMWGIIYQSRKTIDRLHYLSSTKATYQAESDRLGQWIKEQGVNDRIFSGWGTFDMNKNSDQNYSLLWIIGLYFYVMSPKLNADLDPVWDPINDEKNWRPQAEAEYNKYDN